ncbi:hypothetical protein ACJX0J_038585, partial [Zea mays]
NDSSFFQIVHPVMIEKMELVDFSWHDIYNVLMQTCLGILLLGLVWEQVNWKGIEKHIFITSSCSADGLQKIGSKGLGQWAQ